jgi:hypothetical protein
MAEVASRLNLRTWRQTRKKIMTCRDQPRESQDPDTLAGMVHCVIKASPWIETSFLVTADQPGELTDFSANMPSAMNIQHGGY